MKTLGKLHGAYQEKVTTYECELKVAHDRLDWLMKEHERELELTESKYEQKLKEFLWKLGEAKVEDAPSAHEEEDKFMRQQFIYHRGSANGPCAGACTGFR